MYNAFYELQREPFHVTPDPEFLFPSPAHKEALAAIIYGIEQRKGFVAITGEVGVGKTTILRSYLDFADRENLKLIYIYNSNLTFDDVVTTLLQELGVEARPPSTFQAVTLLHETLIDVYRKNQTVVLIIDEAQNMPVETLESLRMLSNLETVTEKLIQILLIGQPEFDELLQQHRLRQLRQRIAIHARIGPLNMEDSIAYLEHRLAKVALGTKPVFTRNALRLIAEASEGIPRNLNILSDNALITGYGYQIRPVNTRIVKEVLADRGGYAPVGHAPASPAPQFERRHVGWGSERRRGGWIGFGLAAAAVLALIVAGLALGPDLWSRAERRLARLEPPPVVQPRPEPPPAIQPRSESPPAVQPRSESLPPRPVPGDPDTTAAAPRQPELPPPAPPRPAEPPPAVVESAPLPPSPPRVAAFSPPAERPRVPPPPLAAPAPSAQPPPPAPPAPAAASPPAPPAARSTEAAPAPSSPPRDAPGPPPAPASNPPQTARAAPAPAPAPEPRIARNGSADARLPNVPAPSAQPARRTQTPIPLAAPPPRPANPPPAAPASRPTPSIAAAAPSPSQPAAPAPPPSVMMPSASGSGVATPAAVEVADASAARALPAPPPPSSQTVKSVRMGDTLWTMAEEVYGFVNPSVLRRVQDANPQIRNVNALAPGQEVVFPRVQESPFDRATAASEGNGASGRN